MKYILLITIASLSMSCKNTKEVVDNTNKATETASNINEQDKANKTDFSISFISLGAGIDLKLKDKIDGIISSFEKSNNIKFNHERVNWGREGEFNYNFDLKNLSTSQKEEFIENLKKTIGTSNMAHIKIIK